MKLKFFLLSIACMLLTMHAGANIFNYGIRGGVNTVSKINNFSTPDYKVSYKKGDPGFHFGGICQVKFAGFFVQPELLFTVARTDLEYSDDSGEEIGKQNYQRVDVPVMLGWKFGPLKLQAGPSASMLLNTNSNLLDKYHVESAYSGATFGYQAGVGLQLANLLLDVKYEGNLSKLGDGITIDGTSYSFDQRMSQWVLSIGFFFGG